MEIITGKQVDERLENMRLQIISDPEVLAVLAIELSHSGTVGIDFETTGLDPLVNRIRTVQIARMAPDGIIETFIIDAFKVGPALPLFLEKLLVDPAVCKIIHNAKFEISFVRQLCRKRIPIHSVVDTLLASQLCNAGYFTLRYSEAAKEWKRLYPRHSLQECCQRYLGIQLNKLMQTSDWAAAELSDDQIRYAALDAAIMLYLWPILSELMEKNRLTKVAKIEFEAISTVVEKELKGLSFDAPAARALLTVLDDERLNIMKKLEKAVVELGLRLPHSKKSGIRIINPMSPRDVQKVFAALGKEIQQNDEAVLEELAAEGIEFAADLLQYRKLHKQTGYIKSWLEKQHPLDDRLHTSYMQIQRNNTGRFSSSSPNLQQIPGARAFRSLFKVNDDRRLIDADYAAVELRIAADVCGETRMIRAFKEGIDLHKQTAAVISGKNLEEITKIERNQAKATNFGLIYGCGATTLTIQAHASYGVEMSLEEATTFHRKFFEYYPSIRLYHRRRCRPENQLMSHYRFTPEKGFYAATVAGTRTLSGRLRVWPSHEGHTQARFTDLANTPVQGTGADILKIALARLYEALLSKGWEDVWIVGSTHDEIILEAPKDKASEAAELLVSVMEAAGAELIKKVPIKAEVEIREWLSDKG